MSQPLQAIRGTRDILPGESERWQVLESRAREAFAAYGYQEIRTPMFEHTELFKRAVGEGTDIVGKEMYTFTDRGDRSVTLRPEGTASVVRAYQEHHLGQGESGSIKLFYMGPMFRYERPQAGRYRQFHQAGAEAIGYAQPASDVESIALLMRLLTCTGLRGLSVSLNSVGCPQCRPAYNQRLSDFLHLVEGQLSDESRARLGVNTLRVLDSKLAQDIAATAKAPKTWNFLCTECSAHFAQVTRLLDALKLPYALNARLVRGLDYYTKTVFEVQAEALGAQNAVAGGGRYDKLVGSFGGAERPAVGFAIGLERLLALLEAQGAQEPMRSRVEVFLACQGDPAWAKGFEVMEALRVLGVRAQMDLAPGRSFKAQFKQSAACQARFTVVLGDSEMESGQAGVKDMQAQTQDSLALQDLAQALAARVITGRAGA
jgi:histidyl-tRNA synthetase